MNLTTLFYRNPTYITDFLRIVHKYTIKHKEWVRRVLLKLIFIFQPNLQPVRQVPQMQVNQRATLPSPVQQMNQPQQQPVGPYGQPQVTSSTDMQRNANNPPMRQMMNNQMNYARVRQAVPAQQTNFQMQQNANYAPRQMVHQQSPQAPMRQRAQVPPPQQQQQQPQQVQQAPPPYNNSAQLPMPLRTNKNISITTLPSPSGPSPSKQR